MRTCKNHFTGLYSTEQTFSSISRTACFNKLRGPRMNPRLFDLIARQWLHPAPASPSTRNRLQHLGTAATKFWSRRLPPNAWSTHSFGSPPKWPAQNLLCREIVLAETTKSEGRDCSRSSDEMCVCYFHALLCCLSSASARRVGVGVCGCTPIFPWGKALRPEQCDKSTRPSLAIPNFCIKSLSTEEEHS